jgi:hypothetical protein
MKKSVIAYILFAMMIAVVPVSAYAQDKGPLTNRSDKEKKRDAEIEKAYKDAIKRTGDDKPAAPSDPWQSVRPPATDNTKQR